MATYVNFLSFNVPNFDKYCFSGALMKLKTDFEEFPKLQLASKKTITYSPTKDESEGDFLNLGMRKRNFRTEVGRKFDCKIKGFSFNCGTAVSPASVSSFKQTTFGLVSCQKAFLFCFKGR